MSTLRKRFTMTSNRRKWTTFPRKCSTVSIMKQQPTNLGLRKWRFRKRVYQPTFLNRRSSSSFTNRTNLPNRKGYSICAIWTVSRESRSKRCMYCLMQYRLSLSTDLNTCSGGKRRVSLFMSSGKGSVGSTPITKKKHCWYMNSIQTLSLDTRRY